MTNPIIDLLLSRRSVSANSLGEPGPNAAELDLMLRAASRVPDHKKLVPWRFVLFQGEGRAEFGKVLAQVCAAEEGDAGAFRLENEAKRFLRAPLVMTVISRVVKNAAAPEWEQVLSAGARRKEKRAVTWGCRSRPARTSPRCPGHCPRWSHPP